MTQFGIFNDESSDWTEAEAVESGMWSLEEAQVRLAEYDPEDGCEVHKIEEEDDEE